MGQRQCAKGHFAQAIGCALTVQAFQAVAAQSNNLWQTVQATSHMCNYVGAM